MSVADSQRDSLNASWIAWQDARMRYADEARKYVAAWFEGEQGETPEVDVDRRALETLTRLHDEVGAAQNGFAAVADAIRKQSR